MKIGIVSPSWVVPPLELRLGIARLRSEGFDVEVHPQCKFRKGFYAGSAQQRAEAFYEFAMRPDIDAIWSARGGSGSIQTLPILDRLARERGRPSSSKLFLGFSDATALHEFVIRRWGWTGLHTPMPAGRPFSYMPSAQWNRLIQQVRARGQLPFQQKLKWLTAAPKKSISGKWMGGNMTVLGTLVGTPYSLKAAGGVLFLEDVTEAWYRLDRVWDQMELAGVLSGVQAVVLGTFEGCRDSVPDVLKKIPRSIRKPKSADLGPLRPGMNERKALLEVFAQAGDRLGIPVAYDLKVGHGDRGMECMPMGGAASLSPDGALAIRQG